MVHQFLRFHADNAKDQQCIEVFRTLWNRRGAIAEPRRLCWDTMRALNQEQRLRDMLDDPMDRLLSINQSVYQELTIEFFSSYSYTSPRKRENPDFTNAGQWGLEFRLGGTWYQMSVAELGVRLGIYTEEEVLEDNFTEAKFRFDSKQEKTEFWTELTGLPDYNPQSAKASKIRDPLLRAVHQVICHTMAGRKDSQGNCPTPDLLFLYSLVGNEPVNLAALLANFFINAAGRTSGSEIHGGEYVTVLAHNLGIMERARGLHRVQLGGWVNMQVLKNMGIVHEANGICRLQGLDEEIWDPRPPGENEGDDSDDDDSDDDDEEEEEDEHGDDGTGGDHIQQQQQFQQPPPNFYGEFTTFRDETRSNFQSLFDGFNYLFTDLHAVFPSHFGNPPHPFSTPGDKRRRGHDDTGPSGSRQDDD